MWLVKTLLIFGATMWAITELIAVPQNQNAEVYANNPVAFSTLPGFGSLVLALAGLVLTLAMLRRNEKFGSDVKAAMQSPDEADIDALQQENNSLWGSVKVILIIVVLTISLGAFAVQYQAGVMP